MRMPSGVSDQYIYFVAVDATDKVTPETGLTSFTVYRSRNGGAATAYTTPTITEVSSANMPGWYKFLLDEDMTIDAGDDSQEMALHITCAGMAPVYRTIEIYRRSVASGLQISGDVHARVGAPAGASIAADVAAVKTDTAAVKTKTDNLPSDPADASDIAAAFGTTASAISAVGSAVTAVKAKTDNLPASPAATGDIPTAVQNADALLGRNISGGSSSGRLVKQAFHFIRNKWVVAGGNLTVYDTDDSTTSWTAPVTGTPGADPITGIDPS